MSLVAAQFGTSGKSGTTWAFILVKNTPRGASFDWPEEPPAGVFAAKMKSAGGEAVGDLVKAVGGKGVEPAQGFMGNWNAMFGVAGDEEGDTG